MGYVLGKCPHCNNVMSMPDDSLKVLCPTCKNEVFFAEAAALAGNGPDAAQNPANGTDPYGRASNEAFAGGSASTSDAPGTSPANPYASAGTPTPGAPATWETGMQAPPIPQNAPLLNIWKTNALFTVLGIAASMLLSYVLERAQDNSLILALSVGFLVFVFVYALKLYPSYFSDKPALDSNEAISFLNGFVGGIIFGLLWNHNLTLKNKGVSHIVFVALIAGVFVLGILSVILLGAALLAA